MSHRKISLIISQTLTVAFPVLLAVLAVFMPRIVHTFVFLKTAGTPEVPSDGELILLTTLSYLALLVAAAADLMLFLLLLRVGRGEVFTENSVSLISGISYCLFAIGVIFAVIGFRFLVSFLAAFAGIFLGLCIRVVKNVIDEGVRIKSENDLTI